MHRTIGLVLAGLASFSPLGAYAADDKKLEYDLEALKKDVEIAQQRTALTEAKLKNTQLIVDQLPSFEGKAETDANTGKFESTQLAVDALGVVAKQIAKTIEKDRVLILAGDERFAFGLPFAANAEMRRLHAELVKPGVCGVSCHVNPANAFLGFDGGAAIMAISAVAGMLRSDVKYTSLSVDAPDSRMLADAIAARINRTNAGGQARVIGGSPGTISSLGDISALNVAPPWQTDDRLADKYAWLLTASGTAKQTLASLSATKKSKAANKDRIAKITQWQKDYDAFDTKVTKPDDDGVTPIGAAVQAEALEKDLDKVVRVDVELADGTLKNSKNIATFFGADPVRVTGGIIASYRTYDVKSGSLPTDWGVWGCGSDQMKLQNTRVQRFSLAEGGKGATCLRRGAASE